MTEQAKTITAHGATLYCWRVTVASGHWFRVWAADAQSARAKVKRGGHKVVSVRPAPYLV